MTDVLIVCASEDTAAAQFLCDRLAGAGYVAGVALGDATVAPERTAALAVLWSPRSAARTDLLRLGQVALAEGRLISLGMENMRPETALGQEPWIDLTGWTGREDFPAWRTLVAEVSRRVGQFAVPGPPPVAPPPPAMPAAPPPAPLPAPSMSTAPPLAPVLPTDMPPAIPAAPVITAPPLTPPPVPPAALSDLPAGAPAATYTPPPASPPPYTPPPPSYGPAAAPAGGLLARVPASAILVGALAFVMLLIAGVAGFYWVRDQNAARDMRAGFERLDREDPAALRAFIEENPRSRQVADARAALETLERRRFEEASASNDQAKLRAFLSAFPNSTRRQEAMNRISEIQALEAAAAASRAQLPGQLPPANGPFGQTGTGVITSPPAPQSPPGSDQSGPRSLRPPGAGPAAAPAAPAAPAPAEDDFEAMLRQGQQDQRIQPTR